jgi:hypothetical protein
MMETGAAFSNPSSGKIDQQRKILEVGERRWGGLDFVQQYFFGVIILM